ncbi:hypothetical protein DRQ21_07040 [Candidatus Fermentibacteria bacterium]|nr:MAG: hypothetical protein DRQ21_07040 [Candidatus Fermentibacteria bacterium]
MKYTLALLAVAAAAAFSASWSIGPDGLSGWPGLPCSDILEKGLLRAGMEIQFVSTDDGTILRTPLKALWGAENNIEAGIEIPVIPVDNAYNGSAVGDITLSGGWLYERARGGTALKFTGRLTVPSGEENRDRGSELAFGAVTSSTFLDFRLSMSAEYALNGGRNPFDDTVVDVMYFNAGGSSFITPDFLLYAAMNGTTSSKLVFGCGAEYLFTDEISLDGGIRTGIDNFENVELYVGANWTGQGF